MWPLGPESSMDCGELTSFLSQGPYTVAHKLSDAISKKERQRKESLVLFIFEGFDVTPSKCHV